MNRRSNCAVLMALIANLFILGFAPNVSTAQENTLGPRLTEIDRQRTLNMTLAQMEKIEAQYLKLLEEYDSPDEKGKIYAAISNSYINSGIQTPGGLPVFPEKVAEYCEKALQYPQDIPKRCRFYSFWGAALQAEYYKSGEQEFPVARKRIVIPYLKVLNLVFDNLTSREMQEPPVLEPYRATGPPNNAIHQKLLRRHQEQLARCREVMLNRQLLPHLHTLMPRCVSLYSRKPYATAELRKLAGEILKKGDAVDELISAVESKIKETDPGYANLPPEEHESVKKEPEEEPEEKEQPESGKLPKPETARTPVPEKSELAEQGTSLLMPGLIIATVVLAGVVVFLLLRRRG